MIGKYQIEFSAAFLFFHTYDHGDHGEWLSCVQASKRVPTIFYGRDDFQRLPDGEKRGSGREERGPRTRETKNNQDEASGTS